MADGLWNGEIVPTFSPRVRVKASQHGFTDRRLLEHVQGFVCYLCGCEIKPFGTKPWSLTVDHVMPKSKGGRSTIENKALACRKCNGEKADKYPTHEQLERGARVAMAVRAFLERL